MILNQPGTNLTNVHYNTQRWEFVKRKILRKKEENALSNKNIFKYIQYGRIDK